MNKKVQTIGLTSSPETIHLETVRAFVTHYCQEFDWTQKALGAIRARDLKTLLNLADKINENLILSATGEANWPQQYANARAFKLGLQFVALVGKYQYPKGSIQGLDPESRAVENFLADERRNRRLNIVFRAHRLRGTDRHWSVPIVRKVFKYVLGETPFYERILDKCDFSGGSSVGHSGQRTHLAAKLGGARLTGGQEAFSYFELALWRNPHYRDQFMASKNSFVCIDRKHMVDTVHSRFEICEYNKIEVVAKNAKSGRTIAKEPEVNNYLQKGPDIEIRYLLQKRLGIDLRKQGPNQQKARRGALLWEQADEDVTIDVKSASNGVLTEVIRSVSPARWYHLLDQLRSQNYMLNGVTYPYEMFCSMGNGFCFPLETLLFAAICHAAYEYAGMKPDYRCYGDDIVVKRSVALVVIEILRAFGFRTNVDKTYIHGPFRESCGANSYGGQEVTPGYYKDPVTTQSELYAQHNSLSDWPKVQAVLRKFAPENAHFVPDLPRYRWVTDQAFIVPLDIAMSCRGVYWNRHLQGWFNTVLTTVPRADTKWHEEFHGTSVDSMVFTAVLRGAQCHTEPFHLRHTTKRLNKRLDLNHSIKHVSAVFEPEAHDAHVKLWMHKNRGRKYAHLRRSLYQAVAHYKTDLVPV